MEDALKGSFSQLLLRNYFSAKLLCNTFRRRVEKQVREVKAKQQAGKHLHRRRPGLEGPCVLRLPVQNVLSMGCLELWGCCCLNPLLTGVWVCVRLTGSLVLGSLPSPNWDPAWGRPPALPAADPAAARERRSSTFGSLPPLRGSSYFSVPIFVCLSPFPSFVCAGGGGQAGGSRCYRTSCASVGSHKRLKYGSGNAVCTHARTHAHPWLPALRKRPDGETISLLIVLHLWEGED